MTANSNPNVSTRIKRLRPFTRFPHRNRKLPPFWSCFHRLTINDSSRRVVCFLACAGALAAIIVCGFSAIYLTVANVESSSGLIYISNIRATCLLVGATECFYTNFSSWLSKEKMRGRSHTRTIFSKAKNKPQWQESNSKISHTSQACWLQVAILLIVDWLKNILVVELKFALHYRSLISSTIENLNTWPIADRNWWRVTTLKFKVSAASWWALEHYSIKFGTYIP